MRKRRLVCISIIISLITTNIAFGEELIVKGNENINKLVSEIDSLLKVKYADSKEYGDEDSNTNQVYKIKADSDIINTTSDLKLKIEQYITNKQVLDIQIIDKGHKVVSGDIVGKEYSKYDRYESSQELYQIYSNHKNEKPIKDIQILDKNNLKTTEVSKIEKVLVTLLNNQEVEIIKGNDKLDLTKYIDKNGNKVDLTNVDINTVEGLSTAKAVVGFDKAKELGYVKEFDILSKVVSNIKVVEEASIDSKNLSEFYNGYYSKAGKSFISTLADKVFYNNGDKFNICYNLLTEGSDEEKSSNNVTKIIYRNGSYSFDINMNVTKDKTLYLSGNQNFKLTIYSDNQVRLNNFRKDVIDAIVNENKSMASSEYHTLAGNDRFETSVEISKEYTKINNANGIILVGENAVVDGLSASPFAKYKNSPILLTKKNEVPKVVLDEIKRIFSNYKGTDTIYLIGGEGVISNEVRKQLISELNNVRVVRIDGEDRYQTSINISNRMNLNGISKAYVVGGDGEVDAMSIAPIAVRQGAPIIVSPKEGISKEIDRFVEDNEGITDVNIIGGQSVVSTDVMLDIKNAAKNRNFNKDIDISRVWGDNRQTTNAKVLEMFGNNSEDEIIVAKDGMNSFSHLVDSMVGASLGYPVVLATDTLADEQAYAVNKILSNTSELIQVGYGISDHVIDRLISLFNVLV